MTVHSNLGHDVDSAAEHLPSAEQEQLAHILSCTLLASARSIVCLHEPTSQISYA